MTDQELCKELYELTGWESETTIAHSNDDETVYTVNSDDPNLGHDIYRFAYDYSTDYLLTKLPAYHEYWNGGNESGYFHLDKYNRDWVAGYTGLDENNAMQAFTFSALTPKTALLKLAIELTKAGVIGKEGE